MTDEPTFGSKVKVVTNDQKAAHLYNAQGKQQSQTRENGQILTVFETKEINGQIFYRVGDQSAWLAKSDTNYARHDLQHTTLNNSSNNLKDIDKYNLSVKKGLTLEKGSVIPDLKGMKNAFKFVQEFPEGTKFEWINPPDTTQNKYTNAEIRVTFPDGSFREHSIHYNISPRNQASPASDVKTATIRKNDINNLKVNDLNFDFIRQNEVIKPLASSTKEAVKLYEQGFYKQMSNTIRQGLEGFVDNLLILSRINPGMEWKNAVLSNKLGYIAHLRLLPKRIMDLCFSIKNYGNIGSHNNDITRFNQMSALADLRQYHDLLVYLTNTYHGDNYLYADIQIMDEQSKHHNWYLRPKINPVGVPTFKEYLDQKNNPVGHGFSGRVNTGKPIQNQPGPMMQQESKKAKMNLGMKALLTIFAILGVIIIVGIGYEIMKMTNNNTQTQMVQQKKSSIKQQAAKLSTKQLIALSLIYADRNDDSKLDDNWQDIYDDVSNNTYNVGRFDSYTFGDMTVTAQGNNHIYVFKKNVGMGYQDKNGQRLVSFFDANQSEPVRAYDYQMLSVVNNISKVKKLAKKIVFTDESQN